KVGGRHARPRGRVVTRQQRQRIGPPPWSPRAAGGTPSSGTPQRVTPVCARSGSSTTGTDARDRVVDGSDGVTNDKANTAVLPPRRGRSRQPPSRAGREEDEVAGQKIRIRLKAYDHEAIDASARKIVETVT